MARQPSEDELREEAEGAELTADDLVIMAIALGGDAKTVDVGKSPKKKLEAVIKLRAAYFENAGKAPKLAERPSPKK